jgi:aspartyl-tRNA(Asn)/glutamyl-tRNA(Gln) amidotransferase subunit B
LAVQQSYEPVIGLEVHAQLKTDSKLFCNCPVGFGATPNSQSCPICLGHPGTLPTVNKKAVELALQTISALGGEIQTRSSFARKNYFYPDLPKGYQISQYEQPLGLGGAVAYSGDDGASRKCELERIHLEEDAAKLIHPEDDANSSYIDFNRCGVPLVEIVARPDIRSSSEAVGYLTKLKQILQYLEVCSGDMEKGHLRCDANVSLRPIGSDQMGARTEVKNLNSFRAVRQALEFEINRQTELLNSGKPVEPATLWWNERDQAAEIGRSKEESHEYRYFPEPDLVDLEVTEEWLRELRGTLPKLPDAKLKRFVKDFGIRDYDARVLTEGPALADYFQEVMREYPNGQTAANWVTTELLGRLKELNLSVDQCPVRPMQLVALLNEIEKGHISGRMAKEVLDDMMATGDHPAVIITKRGLAQITDQTELSAIVDEVLSAENQNVQKYKSGKIGVFAFLVGQVMKATSGKANPQLVNELLHEKLDG